MAIRVAKPPRLPSAYQEVEYIQSTGTQYIDLGMYFTNATNISIDVAFTNARSGWTGIIGGQTNNSGSSLYTLSLGISNSNTATYQRASTSAYNIDFSFSPTLNQKYNMSTNGRNVYVDGVLKGTIANDSGSFTAGATAQICRVNYTVGTGFPYNLQGKVYSVVISGDRSLNLIPCYRKSDSVIGLYDLVNGVFYTNQGTGTFLMGRPINALPQGYQEVEYIHSDGLQRLNIPDVNLYQVNIYTKFLETNYVQYACFMSTETTSKVYRCIIGQEWNGTQFRYNFGSTDHSLYDFNTTQVNVIHTATYDNPTKTATLDGVSHSGFQGFGEDSYIELGFFGTTISNCYSIVIKENNIVTHNLIPCINPNNEAGMYDIASGQFYGNSGTGVFTAGNPISYYHNINPVMFGSPRLPSEYQEVEWIASDGNCYFDIGVYPNQIDKIKATIKKTTNTDSSTLIGSDYNDNRFFPIISVNTGSNAGISGIMSGTWAYSYIPATEFTEVIANCKQGGTHSIILNGNTYTGGAVTNPNVTMRMFTAYRQYSQTYYWNSPIATKEVILYLNDKIVRKFVPCYRKNDNVIGMYEILTNTFYYNQGTGTFTKGADHDTYGHNIKKVMLGTADGYGKLIYTNDTTKRYLYDSGNECKWFTGGWILASTASSGTITNQNNRIECRYVRGNNIGQYRAYAEQYIITTNKIDVTNFSKLCFTYNCTSYPRIFDASYSATSNNIIPANTQGASRGDLVGIGRKSVTSNTEQTDQYDISTIQGEIYLYIGSLTGDGDGYSANVNYNITKVWLE